MTVTFLEEFTTENNEYGTELHGGKSKKTPCTSVRSIWCKGYHSFFPRQTKAFFMFAPFATKKTQ